jgi:HEAT repeat protein
MSGEEARRGSAEPAEAPVLADLADAGYKFDSLADLRHSRVRYRGAVPVLLRWLARATDSDVKENIVRALSVPWAGPAAARALIEEFRRVDTTATAGGTGLRWAIGNALEVVGDDSVFDELVDLVRDRTYGKARQMVVLGLGKSKDPRAAGELITLLDDDDVSGHAVKALGKLKAAEARTALEPMLHDSRPWVRREAKKALDNLG